MVRSMVFLWISYEFPLYLGVTPSPSPQVNVDHLRRPGRRCCPFIAKSHAEKQDSNRRNHCGAFARNASSGSTARGGDVDRRNSNRNLGGRRSWKRSIATVFWRYICKTVVACSNEGWPGSAGHHREVSSTLDGFRHSFHWNPKVLQVIFPCLLAVLQPFCVVTPNFDIFWQ